MIRGTTPTHTFHTNVDISAASVVYVTYKQGEDIVVDKTGEDLEISPSAVTVKLSQAETLQFDENKDVLIQIRARMSDGSAIASNLMSVPVEKVLHDGVI